MKIAALLIMLAVAVLWLVVGILGLVDVPGSGGVFLVVTLLSLAALWFAGRIARRS